MIVKRKILKTSFDTKTYILKNSQSQMIKVVLYIITIVITFEIV